MIKIRDRFILVLAAGFLASIFGMLTLHFLNFVFPGKYINMPLIGLEVFLNVYPLSILKVALGIASSFAISGFYASVYVLVLDLTGWRYMWIKAVSLLNGCWFLFGHGIMRLLNIGRVYRDEPFSIAAFYLGHIFYGTYLFFAVYYLGEREQEPAKSEGN